MKKKIAVFMVCIVLISMAGCSKKNNSDKQTSNFIHKLCSLENAYDVENVYKQKYDNIEISHDFLLQQKNSLIQGEYKIADVQEYNEKIYELFFKNEIGKKNYNPDCITNDLSTYPVGPSYDDGENYVSLGCTGYYASIKNETLSLFGDGTNMDVLASYNLYDSKNMSNTIELSDGKVALSNLKSKLQNKIDDNLKSRELDDKVSLIPKMAYLIRDKQSNQKYIYVSIQQLQKDVGLADVLDYSATESSYSPVNGGYAFMTSATDFSCVVLLESGVFDEVKIDKDITKIIPLSEAIKIASEKLTNRLHYKIEYVTIENMMNYKYNLQEKEPEQYKTDYEHRKNAPWSTTCSYDVFLSKPYWAIYFDSTYKKEAVAFVDCQTGDVIFVNNRK